MKKLFWEDAYMTQAKSPVLRVTDNSVILEETIIYAFSGGQESDSGKINGIIVNESKLLPNGDIMHTLASNPGIQVGDQVSMEIDWEKRYRIMKLHSATHMAMAIFFDMVGPVRVIGANISGDKGRIDYAYEEPISAVLPQIENKLAELVGADLEIITGPDDKSSQRDSRIWLIDGMSQHWRVLCGGTHPRRTGEIGKVTLKRKNIGGGKERVEVSLV